MSTHQKTNDPGWKQLLREMNGPFAIPIIRAIEDGEMDFDEELRVYGDLVDAKDRRIAELEKGLHDLRHAWAQHASQPYLGVESWQAAAAAMAEARAVQEGAKK